MAGITFTVELQEDATRRLTALVERMDRPIGFYQSIGDYFVAWSIRENFETESAPDGTPWASLRPATIARREKKGHTPIQILHSNSVSNQNLAATIHYHADSSGVEIGSSLPYAGTHQFGASQGQFGRTRRGAPIPWGQIPARPFLGMSDEDEQEILRICTDWLELE